MGLGTGNGNANLWSNKVGSSSPAFQNLYSVFFNGVDQSLTGSGVPLLGTSGTGDFSISFWVKADVFSTGSNQRLFAFGTGGTVQTQLFITGGGALNFGGPWSDAYNFSGADNTWYNIIYRVNRASATNNVGYVLNGTTFNNKSQNVTTTFDSTGTFYLGRNSGSYGFKGNLDEISIWNKYLTNADCVEIYNGGTPNDLSNVSAASNLQNWWRMGDPSGPASYPTIAAAAGSISFSMVNMTGANIETDVP